jgi:voltage-gated potassium channel Kch
MKSIPDWEDGFGRPIMQRVNPLDMPSSYPASPERYRYEINGSRVRIGSTQKVTSRESDILVEPDAGDTIRVRSAERIRYIVGYEGVASWAWRTLTKLGDGDTVRVGVSDTQGNGYVVEYTGTGPAADEYTATAYIENATQGVVAESSFEPPVDPTKNQRDSVQWNWYNVGRAKFRKTYTKGGRQNNPTVAKLSNDEGGATDVANLFLVMEIEAANAGQQLSVGSMGHVVLGDATPTSREKEVGYTGLSYGGSGDYEPLCAFRIDPSRDNIYAQVSGVSTTGHAEDGEVIVVCVDPSLTDATIFSSPAQVNPDNSVIQGTTSISTFPDSTYTEVSSASSHGGRQAASMAVTSGAPQSTSSRISESFGRKRPIYSDEMLVVLIKTLTSTADTGLGVMVDFEEEW